MYGVLPRIFSESLIQGFSAEGSRFIGQACCGRGVEASRLRD